MPKWIAPVLSLPVVLVGMVGVLGAQPAPVVPKAVAVVEVQACVDVRIRVNQEESRTYECMTQTGWTCVVTISPYGVAHTCMSASSSVTTTSR